MQTAHVIFVKGVDISSDFTVCLIKLALRQSVYAILIRNVLVVGDM